MKKCIKCGAEWPDTTKFCSKCGMRLEESSSKKKSSLIIKIIVLLLIVGMAFGVGKVIFLQKEDSTCIVFSDGKYKVVKNDETIEIPNGKTEWRGSDMGKFSPDKKYFFYLSRYDMNNYSGKLYRCEYKKLRSNSEKNEQYCELIDANTDTLFYPLNDGKVVYLDAGYNLMYYDGEQSKKIDKAVDTFYCSQDQKQIIYSIGDENGNKLYGVNLDNTEEKRKLVDDYDVMLPVSDFNNIFYYKYVKENDERELYVTGFDRDSEKMGYMISDMYEPVNETVTFLENNNEISIWDKIIVDSLGRTEEIDNIKRLLRTQINIMQLDLYTYKNGEKNLINGNIADARFSGNTVYYITLDNLKIIDLADMEEENIYEEVFDQVFEQINKSGIYILSLQTGEKIHITGNAADELQDMEDEEYATNIYVSENDILLEHNDYEEDESNLFTASIEENEIKEWKYLSEKGLGEISEDSKLYYTNEYYENNGGIYCNMYSLEKGESKCIAQNAICQKIQLYEDGQVVTCTDYEDGAGYELTLVNSKGTNKQVGEEVSDYVRCDDNRIIYLSDDNLYSYIKGKSKKIAYDIDAFWCSDTLKEIQMSGVERRGYNLQ